MLFNSYFFVFAFLPITFALYFFFTRFLSGEVAIVFLVTASLFFYGWWNPIYLPLILISMGVNYFAGELISRARRQPLVPSGRAKIVLLLGLAFNIGLLSYFKYAGFFVENINSVLNTHIDVGTIVLPLAISFFTFQQIAYLVDTYRGVTEEFRISHYALFVTFFPQLIAGPIVHHKEMLPQFLKMENMRPQLENVVVGMSIFALGLFKKTVLADGVAEYATPVFESAAAGESVSFFVAWGGALSYTFQLYFDFSGYSDMAIGIARVFGIVLPLNFASPYKSLSIIEFWRRWHITLSRFLRDYLYIPLGGSRRGLVRRHGNLLLTMVLGGLWHGAGWTFVIWGGLHGLYLVVNHAWHWFKERSRLQWLDQFGVWQFFCWALTFFAVVNAWVLFRATTLESAGAILAGMYGVNGITLPNSVFIRLGGLRETLTELGVTSSIGGGSQFVLTWLWLAALFLVALLMPNTQQVMKRFTAYDEQPGHTLYERGLLPNRLRFRFSPFWAFLMALVFVLAVFGLTRVSEFLYFQF